MRLLDSFLKRVQPSRWTTISAGDEMSYSDQCAWYEKLRAYYLANNLYDTQTSADFYLGEWDEAMKPLRCVAHRTVEFYVAKLCPGNLPDALPILTENDAIIDPIQLVWKWSNWNANKQVAVRKLALYGDLFIKVANNVDRTHVYMQVLEPQYVSAFTVDERGFIQSIRIDIPVRDDNMLKTSTEIWDAAGYRLYIHVYGATADEKLMGTPRAAYSLAQAGVTFIPFVHAKFQDIGEKRGACSFMHALSKIDEANRLATRLHQMLFRWNKPLFVASNPGVDDLGRPLPAPRVAGVDTDGALSLSDNEIIALPGIAKLESLVPPLQYGAALDILNAHMTELERDLPELAYAGLREKHSDLSGRAIRLMMGDAIDRVKEARGNFEAALSRAHAMALSLGAALGIFTGIGTYDAGNFEHSFREREIIPTGDDERAALLTALTGAGLPLPLAMKLAGYSEPDIQEAAAAEQRKQARADEIAARMQAPPPAQAPPEE